jgi:hypothetical protein
MFLLELLLLKLLLVKNHLAEMLSGNYLVKVAAAPDKKEEQRLLKVLKIQLKSRLKINVIFTMMLISKLNKLLLNLKDYLKFKKDYMVKN